MATTTHSPQPTPARIVEPDGRVNVGWFERPFATVDLPDAPAAHLLAPLRGGSLDWLERGFRRWRLKRWHYVSVVTDRVLCACAVVDAGYVGNAFAYVVDRATGVCHQYTALSPLGRGIRVADSSIDGRSECELGGFGHIRLDNDARAGRRRIDLALEGRLGRRPKPPLRARIEIRDDATDPAPIIVVEESEPGRWLYTHKCYGLEASCELGCGEIGERADMGEALAGMDYNCGYRPRETYWNWAAGCGRLADGTLVGFNLTAHRRWGQAAREHGDATDCALWLGDRREKLAGVEFAYAPERLLEPWRIRDAEGLVDLELTPAGERAEDVNLAVVVSRFHQPYGLFRGQLRDRAGRSYSLGEGIYGVVEQHFARW